MLWVPLVEYFLHVWREKTDTLVKGKDIFYEYIHAFINWGEKQKTKLFLPTLQAAESDAFSELFEETLEPSVKLESFLNDLLLKLRCDLEGESELGDFDCRRLMRFKDQTMLWLDDGINNYFFLILCFLVSANINSRIFLGICFRTAATTHCPVPRRKLPLNCDRNGEGAPLRPRSPTRWKNDWIFYLAKCSVIIKLRCWIKYKVGLFIVLENYIVDLMVLYPLNTY